MELDGCGYRGAVGLHLFRSGVFWRGSDLGLAWGRGRVGDLMCNMVYSVWWYRGILEGALVVGGEKGGRVGAAANGPGIISTQERGACSLVGITHECPPTSRCKEGVQLWIEV